MKVVPIVDPKGRLLRFQDKTSFGGQQDRRNRAEDKYRAYFDYIGFFDATLLFLEFVLAVSVWMYHELLHSETFESLEDWMSVHVGITSLAIICLKLVRNRLINKNASLMHTIYLKAIFAVRRHFSFYSEIFIYLVFSNSLLRYDAVEKLPIYVEKAGIYVDFTLNDFLIAFVILRFGFYALPRCLILGSINRKRLRRIGYIYGIEDSFTYLWKYYLNNYTLTVSIFIYLSGISLFAIVLKIIERPNPMFDFISILKTFYFMYITFASVGYGDVFPITISGKVITIFSFIIGFPTISLFTYSLMNQLNFKGPETKIFNLFQKSVIQKDLEIDIIRFFFYLKRLTNISVARRSPFNKWLASYYLQKFYNSYRQMKSHRLEFKMLESIVQNGQGETALNRLDLYFDIFYKEIERANKNQNEIAKMTRRWIISQ
jgi:hypothetical protein